MSECHSVFLKAKKTAGLINFNDENMLSFAADNLQTKVKIKNANAYIYRYWTGGFYLVSTNWINNPVSLWHLPVEKANGMLWVYHYLTAQGSLPPLKKMAAYFKFPLLPKKYGFTNIRRYFNRAVFKLKKY